jgi:hypothetical protein
MAMSEMIELSDNELEMVAGGTGPVVVVQQNINVNPQVGVAIAVGVLNKNTAISATSTIVSEAEQANGIA